MQGFELDSFGRDIFSCAAAWRWRQRRAFKQTLKSSLHDVGGQRHPFCVFQKVGGETMHLQWKSRKWKNCALFWGNQLYSWGVDKHFMISVYILPSNFLKQKPLYIRQKIGWKSAGKENPKKSSWTVRTKSPFNSGKYPNVNFHKSGCLMIFPNTPMLKRLKRSTWSAKLYYRQPRSTEQSSRWTCYTFGFPKHFSVNPFTCLSGWWLNQPIWKICSSNWIISPIFGVKIKNIWNHHPVIQHPVYGFVAWSSCDLLAIQDPIQGWIWHKGRNTSTRADSLRQFLRTPQDSMLLPGVWDAVVKDILSKHTCVGASKN